MQVYFYIVLAYGIFGVGIGFVTTWLFLTQSKLEKMLAIMKDENHAK